MRNGTDRAGGLARGALAALAVFAAFAGGGFGAGAQGYHYMYRGGEVPLALETGRIAVQAERKAEAGPEAPGSTLVDLLRAGVTPNEVRDAVVQGWKWALFAGDGVGEAGVQAAVAQAAGSGLFAFVSPVFTDRYGPVVITRDILVGFKPEVTRAQARATIANSGAGRVLDVDFQGMPGVYRIESASRNGFETLDAANALSALAGVLFAEPDMQMTAVHDLIPNDPLFGQQWGLRNQVFPGIDMGAASAWDTTLGSSAVVVVVLDDGVQLNHPDLSLVAGIDMTGQGTSGGPANQCDNHGTTVAGCISEKINNGIGGSGVAPGCRVAPAKFTIAAVPCNGSGTFQISWLTGAINFSVSSGARVTNNSNEMGVSGAVDSAYTSTHNSSPGVVHFASSGNGGTGSIAFPASSPDVNGVGAISINGSRASFSQFGPGLDFSAPGESIWTTDRTGGNGFGGTDYVNVDGTSYASPYAAGVAAMVVSAFPAFSAAQVEQQMRDTSNRLGSAPFPNTMFGWGLVRADRGIMQPCAPLVTTHPMSQVIPTGSPAMFTAGAGAGTPPFTYQWFRNLQPLTNGSPYFNVQTPTLTVNPASGATAGEYFCRISNACGFADSNMATLTIGCPGDTNGDNMVNFLDLNVVLGQFGQSGPGLPGDVNHDGFVNFSDLNIILSNFGHNC